MTESSIIVRERVENMTESSIIVRERESRKYDRVENTTEYNIQ